MRRQCEAQTGIKPYPPYRMILCPEAAVEGEVYCEWHMERPSNGMRARSVGR